MSPEIGYFLPRKWFSRDLGETVATASISYVLTKCHLTIHPRPYELFPGHTEVAYLSHVFTGKPLGNNVSDTQFLKHHKEYIG